MAKNRKCLACGKKPLVGSFEKARNYCSACFKKAWPIEDGEWHCAGNFIQKNGHPNLYGLYEVWRDDKMETHIGRYETMKAARKAARENKTELPTLGLFQFITPKFLK